MEGGSVPWNLAGGRGEEPLVQAVVWCTVVISVLHIVGKGDLLHALDEGFARLLPTRFVRFTHDNSGGGCRGCGGGHRHGGWGNFVFRSNRQGQGWRNENRRGGCGGFGGGRLVVPGHLVLLRDGVLLGHRRGWTGGWGEHGRVRVVEALTGHRLAGGHAAVET